MSCGIPVENCRYNGIAQYVAFCVWLVSLSVMFFRFLLEPSFYSECRKTAKGVNYITFSSTQLVLSLEFKERPSFPLVTAWLHLSNGLGGQQGEHCTQNGVPQSWEKGTVCIYFVSWPVTLILRQPVFFFCRRTASTVSTTSRPSIRSSAPSELTCSPPSPEDEFQRSLPAKASAWENGCVRMVFTMEGFLQHHMQPRCKTFVGFWDQDLAYLIRINLVTVHFCQWS